MTRLNPRRNCFDRDIPDSVNPARLANYPRILHGQSAWPSIGLLSYCSARPITVRSRRRRVSIQARRDGLPALAIDASDRVVALLGIRLKRASNAGPIVELAVLAMVVGALACRPADGPSVNGSAPLPSAPASQEGITYVGATACADCHAAETESWRGSHHDRAMEEATESTVLGDFDGATFERAGVTSTFSRREGRYFVRTDGPDGALDDYEIAYTFGVDPLQQYLVAFPGGRYQALGIAWDSAARASRGASAGSISTPSDLPAAGRSAALDRHRSDLELHVRRVPLDQPAQGLSTRTRIATRRPGPRSTSPARPATVRVRSTSPGRATPARRIDASAHRRSARPPASRSIWCCGATTARSRLADAPGNRHGAANRGPASRLELETCARCHARRGRSRRALRDGRPFLDTHRPALLDEGLYFADGQIRDEVYEYGSFLQSKMHAAGVTCSDCHEPHTSELLRAGQRAVRALSRPGHFDRATHHHHAAGSAGAHCVVVPHARARPTW